MRAQAEPQPIWLRLTPFDRDTHTPSMAFSQTMVENFKEAFSLFDKKVSSDRFIAYILTPIQQGQGVIDVAALGAVMRAIGLEPSDAELRNMITEVDGSGSSNEHVKYS